MQITDIAYLAPAQCMFTHSAEGPFIDLGREFGLDHAGRMYIKTSYAQELGVFAGLPSQDQLDAAVEAMRQAREQLHAQEAEIEELREFKAAAEYTLETIGQRVRKKPGRPPKKQEPAASAA